ncbi:MAG: acetyl-CoA carboxylase biotin carboxyl carrier protein [Chthoniobacterales bacterium]
MEIKEIRAIIDMMKKNDLAVFKMEREGFKITLKTNEAGQPIIHTAPVAAAPAPVAAPAPAAPAAAAEPAPAPAPAENLPEIKSPMVGTFYATPSPDAEPFVKPGQKVTADTVVCIIEAMKVMNEIRAEVDGVIHEVCAEHGKPVQFGQALFRLK